MVHPHGFRRIRVLNLLEADYISEVVRILRRAFLSEAVSTGSPRFLFSKAIPSMKLQTHQVIR
jgi:hypothetical protein